MTDTTMGTGNDEASADFAWPGGFGAAASLTFDLDAESGILFDHPEAAGYLDVMTHQAYGPRTGLPRLLRILDKTGVRATFFVPGWTALKWPAAVRSIKAAGHEIAHHGFLHERSRTATPEVLESWLVKGLDALDQVAGVRPIGYRAPMWHMSYEMPAMLAKHGFRYDAGLMDADRPYRMATTGRPETATLIELGSHWSLDDGLAYDFLPDISGSGSISSPTALLERWTAEMMAVADEGGLFIPTCHPYISGRPSRAAAVERLIRAIQERGDVWIATCEEVCEYVENLDLEPVLHEPPDVPAGS
jgi:peptidoglycan-N-acetylglucosamine deacetylase